MSLDLISPTELMVDMLNNLLDDSVVPAGAVGGPADDEQQQLGVVSVVDAGKVKNERTLPLMWPRIQLRCIGHDLAHADLIAQHIVAQLKDRGRTVVTQQSTGLSYLVHWTVPISGPSMHFDSPTTWETIVFVEMLVGTEPVA